MNDSTNQDRGPTPSRRQTAASGRKDHRHLGPTSDSQVSAPEIVKPDVLLRTLDGLIEDVRAASSGTVPATDGTAFSSCAANLSHYLALRRHDIRPIQSGLAMLGLSSLGRLEGHVLPALQATRASLAAVIGTAARERPAPETFFAGERCLAGRRERLFGKADSARRCAIMVTCPSSAADDPGFTEALVERQIEALRINCAHDGPDEWRRMIEHARAAGRANGHQTRVFMDLAGPKIRTGDVKRVGKRLGVGDHFMIVPEGGLAGTTGKDRRISRAECTLEKALRTSAVGDHVYYDDGKLGGVIEEVSSDGLLIGIEQCPPKGVKLKPEKGLNFPDADFGIAALTEKDREDLRVIAGHADGVQYSFVQSAGDVRQLQAALAEIREDWRELALVLKIETLQAIDNLPEIIVQAASAQPTAIMIARGDLAVEIGFARMAEMQEEILWLAEAAHVPVIWATQVLESLVKSGRPSRGEMTDAAMASRAECVMLNKGPFLLDAIDMLDRLLDRMSDHQHKKTARLRALKSW